MARKKVKETEAMIAADAEVKSVRLELSPDVHRDFRIEAAKEGQSMAALAKRLVEEWVAKRKAGGK
jgi:predicted HicB family RNase H-like nuclease